MSRREMGLVGRTRRVRTFSAEDTAYAKAPWQEEHDTRMGWKEAKVTEVQRVDESGK